VKKGYVWVSTEEAEGEHVRIQIIENFLIQGVSNSSEIKCI
jgi:hypothetical protein